MFWNLNDTSIYYDKYYPKFLKSSHKDTILQKSGLKEKLIN